MTAAPQRKHNNRLVDHLPRQQRRSLLAAEARARVSGDWGPWEVRDLPNGVPVCSRRIWAAGVRRAYKNKVFSVLWRPLPNGVHLSVSSLSGDRPSWHEMQRIKNELLGADATAVEIYPPLEQVVDDADAFHLWSVELPPSYTIFEGAFA